MRLATLICMWIAAIWNGLAAWDAVSRPLVIPAPAPEFGPVVVAPPLPSPLVPPPAEAPQREPPRPDQVPVDSLPEPSPPPAIDPPQPSAKDDGRATSILQLGMKHEKDGRRGPAILCHSQVVNAWPDSPQAEKAEARILAMGGELDPAALPSGISALPSSLARRPPRIRRLPDFSAVDAAMQSMGAAALSGGGGGSRLCGAATKTTGAPCRNPVVGGGYCYLHR
jgi:hypothetical protein